MQGDLVVQDNHQPNDADTQDTYLNLFEAHIRPIDKFCMPRHHFYLFRQKRDEAIDGYVIHLWETLSECRFPDEVHDEMLIAELYMGTDKWN